jgi:uncharacterized membrane protein YfcA
MEDMLATEQLVALTLGLLATGAAAGILAGLLGVGGGIVIVPVLFQLLDTLGVSPDVSMHVAVGTSLTTIIATSISSARSHHKRGAIDMDLMKFWAPFVFIGALTGGVASRYIEGGNLSAIFGSVALAVSINMAIPKKIVLSQGLPRSKLGNGALAGAIGMFSSLMGIGGGTLTVPSLTMFSYPVHRAVGTAAAFGLVIAIPASLGFVWSGWDAPGRPPYSLGYVNVPAAVVIFSTSVFTAPIGARIAHSINAQALKIAFAVFLAIVAIRMLARAFA